MSPPAGRPGRRSAAPAGLVRHLAALATDAAAMPRPPRTLTEAARTGDAAAVVAFLGGGADIDERSIGFASPLAAAASAGHLQVVNLLLARGASLDPPGSMFPVLHFTIGNRRLDCIERLVAAGAPVDQRHVRLVVKEKRWEVVDALVQGGLDRTWLSDGEHAGLEAWRKQENPRDPAWRAAYRERQARAEARRHEQPVMRLAGAREALPVRDRDIEEPRPRPGCQETDRGALAVVEDVRRFVHDDALEATVPPAGAAPFR